MRARLGRAAVISASLALALSPSAAQVVPGIAMPPEAGEPVAGDVGLELALFGEPTARPGRPLPLLGTAYETRGLGELRPAPGTTIVAALYVPSPDEEDRFVPVAGAEARALSGPGGQLELAVPMPAELGPAPHLVVRLEHGGVTRAFGYPLGTLPRVAVTVRADRRRYEPAETVHAWVRVVDPESGAPVSGETLDLVIDASGGRLLERTIVTAESGVATADVALGAGAGGSHRIAVSRPGRPESEPALAETSFYVETRRSARLLGTFELDRSWSLPSTTIGGHVTVTTTSGVPLPGARIEVWSDDEIVASGSTDEAGTLDVSITAPSFLDEELRTESVRAHVEHPLGTLELGADYVLAQAPWRIEATVEAGTLASRIPSRVIVAITDPVGEPIAAGVTVAAEGAGLGPRAAATTDAHGLAALVATVPPEGIATSAGGDCAGELAVSWTITVGTRPEVTSTACLRASRRAELVLEVGSPVAAPGETLEVELRRRPDRSGRAAVLAMESEDRTYGYVRVLPSERRARLVVPPNASGVLTIIGWLLAPEDAAAALDDEGLRLGSEEAAAAIVVRPADAFALGLDVDPPLVRVRETTRVGLAATPAPGRAWAAMVGRDEAQHEGELPFAYESLAEDLRAAVRGPLAPGDELLVRLALAVSPVETGHGASPAIVEPWEDPYRASWGTPIAGVLSDPIARRETLVRETVGPWMNALVRLVDGLATEPPEVRAGVVATSGGRAVFGPSALAIAAERGLGPTGEVPRVLGGIALTPAMLSEIDPSFSFDAVARVVARWRLVSLLDALWVMTSSADPEMLRSIDVEPVSRWLAIAVRLGLIEATMLRDPWGGAYSLVCRPGSTPPVLFSARASDCTLLSPGPDGRAGTADDVDDPFERMVPERTLFALGTGEDALMESLSRIAPGSTALATMAAAYAELGLAAYDETIEAALYAHPSEAVIDDLSALVGLDERMVPSIRGAGMASIGHGSGTGSGYGYGYGGLGLRGTGRGGGGVAVALSAAIREDLPATLFFVGEVPLDPSGHAIVPVTTADAMSSYHVEAVAWSASGWITSASGRLRVDQDVEIDAPVPEVLHVGDDARISMRLRSRASVPLDVVVSLETEGGITVSGPDRVSLPAGEIVSETLTIRATEVGPGSVLLRAALEDGSPLDAIRRRLVVREDARSARLLARTVVVESGSLPVEIPEGASARGPATIRISPLRTLFPAGDFPWSGWASALRGETVPPVDPTSIDGDPRTLAFTLGAAWPTVDEETASAALRRLTEAVTSEGMEADAAWLLLGLAPAIRGPARDALAMPLAEVAALLRPRAAAAGATATAAPETWARVAAALALAGDEADLPRVLEMLRRLEPYVVRVGDLAWVEPGADDGSVEPRAEPTALLAIALEALGRSEEALPLVLAFASAARGAGEWAQPGASLVAAAAMALGNEGETVALALDGSPAPLVDGSPTAGVLSEFASPGRHELGLTLGGAALLEAEARFGLPWTSRPSRPLRVEASIDGELGARDTRAALVVHVRNVGARALREPAVRILLPSGAELEEPERAAIAARTGRTVELAEDELVVRAGPLLPGRTLSFPVRVRWSIAGSLRGLGVAVTDDALPPDPEAALVVPSRAIDIPDEGAEPELELDSAAGPTAPAPRASDVVVLPLSAR